jgi:hypothetical protein
MASNLLGKKAIAVWFVLASMVGIGSFTMAVSATDTNTTTEIVPNIDGEVLSLNPIRIDETVDITATNAVSIGTSATHNDMAVINFMGDVGEDVLVTFDVINESSSPLLALIAISTEGNAIASINEASSTFDSIRVVGDGKWLAHFTATGGSADTLAISVTALSPGMQKVTVQITTAE